MLKGTQGQVSMPWAWGDSSSGGKGERVLTVIPSHYNLPSTFLFSFLLVPSTVLEGSNPIISICPIPQRPKSVNQ